MTENETKLAGALKRLLACPDVNLDEIEDETIEAIEEAETALRCVGLEP